MQELCPQNEKQNQKGFERTPISDFLVKINERRCPVCFNNFNIKKRVPMTTCSFQHNVCKKCLKNIVKTQTHGVRVCPLCKQKMRNRMVKKNRLLFQLLCVIKSRQSKKLKQQERMIEQKSLSNESLGSQLEVSDSDQSQIQVQSASSGILFRMQRRLSELQNTIQSLYGNVDRIRIVDADGGNVRRYNLMLQQPTYQNNQGQGIRQVSITRRPPIPPPNTVVRPVNSSSPNSNFSFPSTFNLPYYRTIPPQGAPRRNVMHNTISRITAPRMTAPFLSGVVNIIDSSDSSNGFLDLTRQAQIQRDVRPRPVVVQDQPRPTLPRPRPVIRRTNTERTRQLQRQSQTRIQHQRLISQSNQRRQRIEMRNRRQLLHNQPIQQNTNQQRNQIAIVNQGSNRSSRVNTNNRNQQRQIAQRNQNQTNQRIQNNRVSRGRRTVQNTEVQASRNRRTTRANLVNNETRNQNRIVTRSRMNESVNQSSRNNRGRKRRNVN